MKIHRPLSYQFAKRMHAYEESQDYDAPYDPGLWTCESIEPADPDFVPEGAVVILEVSVSAQGKPGDLRHIGPRTRVPREYLLILDTLPYPEVWDMVIDTAIRPYCCVSYETREAAAVRKAFEMLL